MFYTNATVYSQIPDTTKLKELNQQSYEIILIDKPNLPKYYRKIKGTKNFKDRVKLLANFLLQKSICYDIRINTNYN